MQDMNTEKMNSSFSQLTSWIFDTNEENFQNAVLEKSFQQPVVVDFWAEWCAPCRSLKPILERVITTFQGELYLAKLNTEENPTLSSQYGIRGIPHVKIFSKGKVVGEFTGLLPEDQIVAMLNKFVTSAWDIFKKELFETDLPLQFLEEKLLSLNSNNENQYPQKPNKKFLDEELLQLKLLIDFAKMSVSQQELRLKINSTQKHDESLETHRTTPQNKGENKQVLMEGLGIPSRNVGNLEGPIDKYENYLINASIEFNNKNITACLDLLIELLFRKKDYKDGIAKKITQSILSFCKDPVLKESYTRKFSMAINS